jgi:hypothetical protein
MNIIKILAGIDGTGSSSREEYDRDFAKSFVTRLAWDCRDPNFGYWRGPSVVGHGLEEAVNGAFSFIKKTVMSTRGSRDILLTGYSRGAAGAVALAKRLKRIDLEVRAMLLFDCVDRHLWLDAETIPSNVKNVLHLTRSPESDSRPWFGNDALMCDPSSTKMKRYEFICTHGALGGVPASPKEGESPTDLIKEKGGGTTKMTYAQDAIMSDTVWSFIKPFCTEHGFI